MHGKEETSSYEKQIEQLNRELQAHSTAFLGRYAANSLLRIPERPELTA